MINVKIIGLSNVFADNSNAGNSNVDNSNQQNNSEAVNYDLPATGSLSSSEFNITATNEYYDGYNLFVLDRQNLENHLHEIFVVVIDMLGNIISSRYLGSTLASVYSVAKFINSTTIVVGGILKPFLWNFFENTISELDFNEHHDIEYISSTDTFLTFTQEEIIIENIPYTFDRIVEYTHTGDVVWSVSTQSFVSYTDWCPYQDMLGETRSITHCNSLFYNPNDDTILLNCRNMNTIYKLNHTSKELIWSLGEHGDFDLYNIQGIKKDSLWYHCHAVEYFDDNKIILFDNDYHNQTDLASRFSRIVEIEINEETKTANETWTYVAPREYSTTIWGDADKLPNGDRLGTFGASVHTIKSHNAKILEINEQKEIVWKLDFVENELYEYGIYRFERFRPSPGLEEIETVYGNSIENTTIQLETWSGYRTRTNLEGYYKLYLDDSLVIEDIHIFRSYWRKSILNLNLGKLEVGYHNLTIVLEDDSGHITLRTIDVEIKSFYVIRTGFTEIELGQPDTFLRWEGKAESPLLLNLTINEILYNSSSWFDSNISIDLSSLGIGEHKIEFHLFNSSVLVYNETFYAYVYPAEAPIVITASNEISVTWGEVEYITWNLSDNTPVKWEICVNEISYLMQDWKMKFYELNWKIPNFNEGNYNITISLFDQAGYTSSSTVNLTIISPSPPVLISLPGEEEYQFGVGNISLSWIVHGGNFWNIFIDGSIYSHGTLDSNLLIFQTDDWDISTWSIGKHSVTLEIIDENEEESISTVEIIIWLNKADAYADSIVILLSDLYDNGENALGKPDGETCGLFEGYTLGYITLDMGEQEEILNRNGDDFKVYASGGEYQIWIGNDINVPFTYLGTAIGNSSFNIDSVSLNEVRYVKIQYTQGEFIELDAIEAIYYNIPEWDSTPPEIHQLMDIEVNIGDQVHILTWTAFDSNPYNYSILMNSEIFQEGYWHGEAINCTIPLTKAGEILVTLVLFDSFGNSANTSVKITVFGTTQTALILSIILPSIIVVVGITQLLIRIRKKI